MIRRIFGPAEQRRGHGGALGERKSGQGGSELTADHRRFLLGGQFGQAGSDEHGTLRHQAHEPSPQVLILRGHADVQEVDLAGHAFALEGREDASRSQHPKRTQAAQGFGLERAEGLLGGQQGTGRAEVDLIAATHFPEGAFGKDLAGLAHEKLIRVVQRNREELLAVQRREVAGARLGRAVADAVDAAVAAVPNLLVIIVTSLLISPIGHIQSPVGTNALRHRNEPRVIAPHEVCGMMTDIAAAFGFDGVAHHAVAMKVTKEQKALILGGEVIAVVDGQSAVCMAATSLIGALWLNDATLHRTVQDRACEVGVISDGLDVVVGMRIEVLTRLTLVATAGKHMIEVRDDAGGDEHLAVLVVIEPPWIARAFGEDLEVLGQRVQAPHPGVDALALGVGRAGLADVGMGEDAVAAVQPAIGTPRKTIQRLMGVLHRPAIEDHARLTRLVLCVLRNEEQFRRGTDPDPAMTDFDAAHEVEAFVEDRRLAVRTVAQRVLQNEDAVLAFAVAALARVRHPFDDPETTLLVEAHGDRLDHPRLGGDERHLEALRQGHSLERFGRGGTLAVILESHAALGAGGGGGENGNGG